MNHMNEFTPQRYVHHGLSTCFQGGFEVSSQRLEGVQQLVLGLYIIRGDNISVIGELDEELDSNLDLSKLRAHPLKPVIH
ncbi:sm-like protein LSM8 isoform X2 [Amborella trichopoda]|uniref:sm-like protein LSM8 isoform X2 n=1 Tax=Amborella trichopoda TaxID=13333 RepID=UPI0009BFC947|nr:sm-like protein LSM8 isoform X2 [Amborella trichopoda]|eukprot:XP_020520003.1 sm-like protein LSM8 isoform X2 [Amborella trichopoda]